ncbi:MAG: aldo/keto reductase [Polyangiaceae bacterium]
MSWLHRSSVGRPSGAPLEEERPRAMGCMRLSNLEPDRAEAVIHAALEHGVGLLDTADVYGPSHDAIGHNERLIARALRRWRGDAPVVVATKGGLIRGAGPGRWRPKGTAKHLREACERSLRGLELDVFELYQLHAPDPEVPWRTSLRALEALKADGLARRVGLCNVTRAQLEEAADHLAIDAVQVAISPWDDEALYDGIVDWCRARAIPLLAHSPLGAAKSEAKRRRHLALRAVAARHDATTAEVTLAWLRDLAPVVLPLPGPTQILHATPRDLHLTETDRAQLDTALPGGAWARGISPPAEPSGEVVILMGIQGAGKSTAAERWVEAGYQRLNRDERGGRLAGLNLALGEGLAAGSRRWVLDNTYPTRASRARVIHQAWRHGAAVRCEWRDTPLPEAQINVVRRLLAQHGRLPDAAELTQLAKRDPQALAPRALFRFDEQLAPPQLDEGFHALDRVRFTRRRCGSRSAIMVQLEGVLRRSASGARAPIAEDDVVVDEALCDQLRAATDHALVGISWQPAIAGGELDLERARAILHHTLALADLEVDVRICPHPPGPPRCWCRPPLPGLAVQLVDEHDIDPTRCTFLGRSAADRTLAERMGFRFVDATTGDVSAVTSPR